MDENVRWCIFEAILFAADEPVQIDRIGSAFEEEDTAQIIESFLLFVNAYNHRDGGLEIVEVAGGYRLSTRPRYDEWLVRYLQHRRNVRLSRAALETLAIVAYFQPVITPEIERIRGVKTSGVIQTLMEKEMIRILGRQNIPGRPIMYGTTDLFLEKFGLRDLKSLPSVEEIEELFEESQIESDDK